jgi:hypothetical protein
MQTGNTVEFRRKFARFPIAMEMESALRREAYAPFCRHFSDGSLAVPFRRGMKREKFDFPTRSMIRPGSGSGWFEEAVANSRLFRR